MKAGVSKEEAAKAWHLHPFRQMASLSAVLSSLMQYGASRAYHKFSQKSDYTPEQDAELNRYKKAYTHLLSGKIGDVADQADSAYTSRQQLMGHLKQELQHDQTQRQIDNIRQNRYNETGEGANPGSIIGSLNSLTNDERRVVNDLANEGHEVEMIPRSNTTKTPDFYVDHIKTELKTLHGSSLNTPITRIQEGFKQGADKVIIDARNTSISLEQASSLLDRATGIYDGKLPGTVEIWTSQGKVSR